MLPPIDQMLIGLERRSDRARPALAPRLIDGMNCARADRIWASAAAILYSAAATSGRRRKRSEGRISGEAGWIRPFKPPPRVIAAGRMPVSTEMAFS